MFGHRSALLFGDDSTADFDVPAAYLEAWCEARAECLPGAWRARALPNCGRICCGLRIEESDFTTTANRPATPTDDNAKSDKVRFQHPTLEQAVLRFRLEFSHWISPTGAQVLTSDRTDGCRKEARPDRQEAHCAVQASPE